MSDLRRCPMCDGEPLSDSRPRQVCLDCGWRETEELTRLRAREAVLVEALRLIAHMHGQAECSVTARKALATLDVEEKM